MSYVTMTGHTRRPRSSTGARPTTSTVLTPSNASWLNWIVRGFTAPCYFALDGGDYPSHTAQEAAIAGYVRWYNKHAQPKRRFAIDSKSAGPTLLDEALAAATHGGRTCAHATLPGKLGAAILPFASEIWAFALNTPPTDSAVAVGHVART